MSLETRLAVIEERLRHVQKKGDYTFALVITIVLTTLGTFLTAGAGLILYLVQR